MADNLSSQFLTVLSGGSVGKQGGMVKDSKSVKAKSSIKKRAQVQAGDMAMMKDAMQFGGALPPDPEPVESPPKKKRAPAKKKTVKFEDEQEDSGWFGSLKSKIGYKLTPEQEALKKDELLTSLKLYTDLITGYGFTISIPKMTSKSSLEQLRAAVSGLEKEVRIARGDANLKRAFDAAINGIGMVNPAYANMQVVTKDPQRAFEYKLLLSEIFAKYHTWLSQRAEVSLLLLLMEDMTTSVKMYEHGVTVPEGVPEVVDKRKYSDL